MGVAGSVSVVRDERAGLFRESPRSGSPLSACFGGMGVSPGGAFFLRLGSSKGFTSEVRESTDIGEIGTLFLTFLP